MAQRQASSALPLAALAALIVPVIAGLGWMSLSGAPQAYGIVNAAALGLACVWIVFARAPANTAGWRWLGAAALVLLLLPFVLGPSASGVHRWIGAGPLTLHSGFLAIPVLALAAAADRTWGPYLLGAALLPLAVQPDAGSGLAVTFAAAGIHDRTRDWRYGLVAVAGFFLTLSMAFRGELPPQPFVERVVQQALEESLVMGLLLMTALSAGFFAILRGLTAPSPARYGLAGAFFGFFVMALVSHYPYPLVGYGAASILGFGAALGIAEAGRPA